jgi:O-antigen/teichoic acid export membrane protein/Mrp family chromosome partitioning ATPase
LNHRTSGADPTAGRPPSGAGEQAEIEQQVVGFARGGGLNLLGAVCNQAALLGVTMLVARMLGRADVGVYAQAYAFLSLLGTLALTGLTTGLTRFVAVHLAERDAGAVRGTVRFGLAVSTMTAAALGAALFVAMPWLVDAVFHEPRLAVPLRLVALTLPTTAFTNAALAATQGYRTMKPFALIGLIFEPVTRLALVASLLLLGAGLPGVMAALLVSNLAAAVLAALALGRVMGPPTAPATYRPRELLAFSTMSWLAGLASNGLLWADVLLLGMLGNSGQVGVYNVAARLVHLATFVMVPINAAFAPRIADLYHRGRMDSLRHTYALAGSWIIRLSLPAFVVLLVFPRDLLAFFGRGFAVGAAVTVILAAGKFVDAATGPCGMMLNMSGRPRLNLVNNAVGLVLNIILNLLLIPSYGIVGSAVAWAVSLCLINVARVLQVWLELHMLPFKAATAKGLIAGVLAFIAAVAVRVTYDRPSQLLVGGAAVAVVYLGAILLQGLTAEDRLVLGALLRRRRAPAWSEAYPAAVALQEGASLLVPAGVDGPPWEPAPLPRRARPRSRFVPERPPSRPRARPPVSPARYLRTLWRRRLILLGGLAAGALLAVAVLPTMLPTQPTYRASVRIDVKPFAVDLAANRALPAPTDAELAQQVLDVEVAAQLLKRLKRLPRQLEATRDLPPEQWPTALIAAMRAEPVRGSRSTVELSLIDRSGQRAGQVLELYARRLTAKRNATDDARTREAMAVLEQQARELRLNLVQWGLRVDQERAASPDGWASMLTQSQFDAFRDRHKAKLAEQEQLREQVALRGRPTVAQLPATRAQASAPLGRTRMLVLGVLAGLLTGVLLALLLEAVRPRLTTEADTTSAAGVDVLVSVPKRRRWRSGRPRRGEHPSAEDAAYRRLAFSLERQGLGRALSVVAVVSAELKEGKSAVAVGLARALAHRGQSVVVVSGDLRRPVVERALGVPEVPGLGEYLEISGPDVVSLLVAVRDNLLLLPAGWAGRSPADLLARPGLAEAVEQLRDLDLVVLIDTPAARWWSEALVLAAEADATVLVARAGRSHWKALAQLASILHRDRFPVIGAVLVGARRSDGPRHRARQGRGDRVLSTAAGAPQAPLLAPPSNGKSTSRPPDTLGQLASGLSGRAGRPRRG